MCVCVCVEVTRRRGRRPKKLLDDLKDRRGYSNLKEEALDRTKWRNRFGGGFGPVVRQNTELMNMYMYNTDTYVTILCCLHLQCKKKIFSDVFIPLYINCHLYFYSSIFQVYFYPWRCIKCSLILICTFLTFLVFGRS